MFLFVICCCFIPKIFAAFDCTSVSIANHQFDLSNLFKTDINLSITKPTPPSNSLYEYRFNPCKHLNSNSTTTTKDTCDNDAWLCVIKTYTKDDTTFVAEIQNLVKGPAALPIITYANEPQIKNKYGSILTLTYTGKKPDGEQFEAKVQLQCAENDSVPEITAPTCGPIVFKISSPFACPKSSTGSPNNSTGTPSLSDSGTGLNFLLSLGIIFIIYMVGGTLYRRFILNAEGMDQIPHSQFWADLPVKTMDLFHSLKEKCAGSRHGYIQV